MPNGINNLDELDNIMEQKQAGRELRKKKNKTMALQNVNNGIKLDHAGMRTKEMTSKDEAGKNMESVDNTNISSELKQARNENRKNSLSDKALDFGKTKLPPQVQAVIKAMDIAGINTNKWIKRLAIGGLAFNIIFYGFIILGGAYISLSSWSWFEIWWIGVWG